MFFPFNLIVNTYLFLYLSIIMFRRVKITNCTTQVSVDEAGVGFSSEVKVSVMVGAKVEMGDGIKM